MQEQRNRQAFCSSTRHSSGGRTRCRRAGSWGCPSGQIANAPALRSGHPAPERGAFLRLAFWARYGSHPASLDTWLLVARRGVALPAFVMGSLALAPKPTKRPHDRTTTSRARARTAESAQARPSPCASESDMDGGIRVPGRRHRCVLSHPSGTGSPFQARTRASRRTSSP